MGWASAWGDRDLWNIDPAIGNGGGSEPVAAFAGSGALLTASLTRVRGHDRPAPGGASWRTGVPWPSSGEEPGPDRRPDRGPEFGPDRGTEFGPDGDPASGYLVVRASGAAAAAAAITGRAAPEAVQLLMRCAVRAAGPARTAFGDGTLVVRPAGNGQSVVLLEIAAARLTIGFAELRPLMFQPVRVEQQLRAVFGGAVAGVLAAGSALDPHGLAHHLRGLCELVLRSALRAELNRVDGDQTRRREALAYIRDNLGDPGLNADRVAGAMFLSRRRLYQLFDDGQGVSERIRQLRLDRAKELLADPARAGQSIAEIARACGFVSAAHFSRVFRGAVGLTPSEFRGR